MGFNEEIAKYYDDIFPVQAPQMNFLTKTLGRSGESVLEVACATGGYAAALAQMGFEVTAMEGKSAMVEACKERVEKDNIQMEVVQKNMLQVEELDKDFDLVYCIDNSMVHLDSLEDMEKFLKGCFKVLRPDGRLVIQIANYDRILNEHITSLPTIMINSVEELSYRRLYAYQKDSDKILYTRKLTVDGQTLEDVATIFPLTSQRMAALMEKTGFQEVEIFGDFMKNPYDERTSHQMVVRGRVKK